MMTYDTPEALRMAIEARIGNISDATGIAVDRLRRRLISLEAEQALHRQDCLLQSQTALCKQQNLR